MLVYKFGGATTRSVRGLEQLAAIVARTFETESRRRKDAGLVIVVSAIGHTTRRLREIAEYAENGKAIEAGDTLERIIERHEQLADNAGLTPEAYANAITEFRRIAGENRSIQGPAEEKWGYSNPAVADWDLDGKLDHRVDLWALGTVAHELLTNRRLFDGADDFKTMWSVKFDDIKPPSKHNADVPHDFRDVVVLVDIGDFSYADAAQILDIPMGTVMSRLHRGRRLLKARLAEEAVK